MIIAQESFMRIDGKSLIVGAVLGIGAFVWAPQTYPQTLGLTSPPVRIPYTVDSVFVRYADNGSLPLTCLVRRTVTMDTRFNCRVLFQVVRLHRPSEERWTPPDSYCST